MLLAPPPHHPTAYHPHQKHTQTPTRKKAEHVATHEADCLAYELSISADDPDAFIIYERCALRG